MADTIDIISPRTIGEDKIVLTIDPVSLPLLESNIITLNFDYSETEPEGVVLPLQFIVAPAFGRGVGFSEKIFRRTRPSSFAFSVPGAGTYLALLRECGHNSWSGSIRIVVEGEQFSQIQSTRQEP